jgi:hypothetical protein
MVGSSMIPRMKRSGLKAFNWRGINVGCVMQSGFVFMPKCQSSLLSFYQAQARNAVASRSRFGRHQIAAGNDALSACMPPLSPLCYTLLFTTVRLR